jgi:hypothetical protein
MPPPPRARHGPALAQHGLAHAWVTAQHQGPAFTGPDGVDEPVERVTLGMSIRQARRAARPPRICGHRPVLRGVPVAWLGVTAHLASRLV